MSEQAPAAAASKPKGAVDGYLADSKNPLNTVLLILPLFVIYSVGILTTHGVRNGVDLVSDLLRRFVFRNDLQYLLFNLVVLAVGVGLALWLRRKHQFRPRIYLLVMLEGTLYGLLLAQGVPRLLAMLHVGAPGVGLAAGAGTLGALGLLDRFVLALGAGLWEEIVFRLILLGGSVLLMVRLLKVKPITAWLVGVLVTSLLFSTVHYLGNMADRLELYSFMFRFFSGIVFAAIFAVRGLAVSVYTHAVYDVMVMVILGG